MRVAFATIRYNSASVILALANVFIVCCLDPCNSCSFHMRKRILAHSVARVHLNAKLVRVTLFIGTFEEQSGHRACIPERASTRSTRCSPGQRRTGAVRNAAHFAGHRNPLALGEGRNGARFAASSPPRRALHGRKSTSTPGAMMRCRWLCTNEAAHARVTIHNKKVRSCTY